MIPKNAISFAKARALSSNFNQTRADLHARLLGKDDANAVWYSIEELEEYIDYIKKEGLRKGYLVAGIRFYMGAYSATEPDGRAGYSTVFLSPTGSLVDDANPDATVDIHDIECFNFGSMGNPPKVQYGI